MNMQSSVHSWAIASRLFVAFRSPNTSWRLRLMRVSMVSGTALSPSFAERFRGRSPFTPCPECVAHLLDECLRLLESGEVPTLVKFVPVEQVRPEGLSPFLWRTKDLPRED